MVLLVIMVATYTARYWNRRLFDGLGAQHKNFQDYTFGIILFGDRNWKGKITYRFCEIKVFSKSIKVTIEHGHANKRSDDYSSTAYWYQTEPHKKFPELLDVEKRLP